MTEAASERRCLPVWMLAAEILGILAIALTAYWFAEYYGGFNWGAQVFNFHPLFMVIGFIYLQGHAAVLYRITPCVSKPTAKVLHALVNGLAFIFVVVALCAVFKATAANEYQVYSLHSWIGIATVICFCSQWVFGFVIFLFPGLELSKRDWYLPVHRWMGAGTFALAVAATLLGISEKTYNKVDPFTHESYVFNFLGLTLVAFAFAVGYIVTYGPYARAKPEGSTEHTPLN